MSFLVSDFLASGYETLLILSLEDVHTLLQCVRLPRSQACLSTISSLHAYAETQKAS